MSYRIAIVAAIGLFAVSCKTFGGGTDGRRQYVPSISPLMAPPSPFPARGGASDDWGLALSGGGIRSAAFAIGVMKALYDAGYMDSVDVISSVSGGGYASYWLFRQYLDPSNTSQRFGETVFSNARFDKSVCELQALGNFQTFGQMIAGLVGSSSFPKYRWAIRRSFGFDDSPSDAEPRLDAVMFHVRRGAVPFFILNATIDATGREQLRNALEISPAFFGNPSIGYHVWTSQDSLPGWSESVAVAGAAAPPLKRLLGNFVTPDPTDSVRVWDGGKSENLAALALIRRRMKNIVIVDAEHDPDFEFGAYLSLRQLLPREGFRISIAGIDSFVDTRTSVRARFDAEAVSHGIVTSIPRNGGKADTSRIFYVKMARPKSVEALFDTSSVPYREGRRYQQAIDKRLGLADRRLKPWHKCAALAGHADGFRQEAVIYNVTNYAHLMDKQVSQDVTRRGPSVLRYDFPQMTTADQSYFTDQLRAVIGLGYLQGLQLKGLAKARRG